MSAIENPPAFPTSRFEDVESLDGHTESVRVEWPGMSLRDWFAGQALAMSQPDGPAHLADWAYRVADAMLAERLRATERKGTAE